LAAMNGITPADMMKLQNDYYNTLAEDMRPILLKYVEENKLSAAEKKYLDIFNNWDLLATPDSKGQTVYQCWLDSLQVVIFKDELEKVKPEAPWPTKQTMMELLIRDPVMEFVDNINTTKKETLYDDVTVAFKKAVVLLAQSEADGKLTWAKFKDPTVYHLLKDALLPFARRGLNVGGNGDIINAVTHSHGPSWRMIVQMSATTEAYGVYPGGQSGNPGSKYYDDYLDNWVAGKYNKLWFMKDGDRTDKNVKWVMKFENQ
jgi:penicillin amidase